jgi:hypothetical protein
MPILKLKNLCEKLPGKCNVLSTTPLHDATVEVHIYRRASAMGVL